MTRSQKSETAAQCAVSKFAFDHYLRTGLTLSPPTLVALAVAYERKFNPNHDPATGRFTSGSGGLSKTHPRPEGSPDPSKKDFYYQGVTSHGVGRIEPTSGGYVGSDGRYLPEVFPPDPYAIKDPASALAHYVGGSGTPLNFYMNQIDTSKLDATKFEDINELVEDGRPGTYEIKNALTGFDTASNLTSPHVTEAAAIGGVSVSANGLLTIDRDGQYHFDGWLGAPGDEYTFHSRPGRTFLGDFSNAIGENLPGKPYSIYVVGTTPFNRSGSLPWR